MFFWVSVQLNIPESRSINVWPVSWLIEIGMASNTHLATWFPYLPVAPSLNDKGEIKYHLSGSVCNFASAHWNSLWTWGETTEIILVNSIIWRETIIT